MSTPEITKSATRRISQAVADFLQALKPGQRVQITQSIRVGSKKWKTTVVGAFRRLNYLATGVTTDRIAKDDVVVPMLHFTKDNGELSSIAIDEHSDVKLI